VEETPPDFGSPFFLVTEEVFEIFQFAEGDQMTDSNRIAINKTTARSMVALFGDDLDGWIGKRIHLDIVPTLTPQKKKTRGFDFDMDKNALLNEGTIDDLVDETAPVPDAEPPVWVAPPTKKAKSKRHPAKGVSLE